MNEQITVPYINEFAAPGAWMQACREWRQKIGAAANARQMRKSAAWKFWIARPSDSSPDVAGEDQKRDDVKDVIVTAIEEYYPEMRSKRSDMITVTGRDYAQENGGSSISEGILVKYEPYATQFSVSVRAILGGSNFETTSRTLQLEPGARAVAVTIRYQQAALPSTEQLIDDVIMWDTLCVLKPKNYIVNDIAEHAVYPTAAQFFADTEMQREAGRVKAISHSHHKGRTVSRFREMLYSVSDNRIFVSNQAMPEIILTFPRDGSRKLRDLAQLVAVSFNRQTPAPASAQLPLFM